MLVQKDNGGRKTGPPSSRGDETEPSGSRGPRIRGPARPPPTVTSRMGSEIKKHGFSRFGVRKETESEGTVKRFIIKGTG